MEAVCRCDPAMTTGFVLGLFAVKIIESLVKFYSNLEDDLDDKLREEIRVEFELQETIEKLLNKNGKLEEQERTLTVEKVQAWKELRREIETPKVHFLPPSGNSKYASLASISQDVEDRALKRKKFVESLPPSVNPNLSNYGPHKSNAIFEKDPKYYNVVDGEQKYNPTAELADVILFDTGAFISKNVQTSPGDKTPEVVKSLRSELPGILKSQGMYPTAEFTAMDDFGGRIYTDNIPRKTLNEPLIDNKSSSKYSFIDDDYDISRRDLQASFI